MGNPEHKMHAKRWLTAVIAVPIWIYLIGLAPRWLFYAFLYGVSMVGLREFYRVSASDLPGSCKVLNHLIALVLFFAVYMGEIYLLLPIIILWAFIPMTVFMLAHPSADEASTGDLGRGILGPVYVTLPLAMLVMVDRYPEGRLWIFFLLTVIVASDTGAFYLGRLFGKHKLYEAVSPGKTWEGAVGGAATSVFAAAWFLHLLGLRRVEPGILLLALILSVAGQIGDLVESMIKRSHQVKDSGRALPGHGGVLDRIDGLLFAIPVLYVYLSLWAR